MTNATDWMTETEYCPLTGDRPHEVFGPSLLLVLASVLKIWPDAVIVTQASTLGKPDDSLEV